MEQRNFISHEEAEKEIEQWLKKQTKSTEI
jgi:hypothetical protein